MRTVAAVIALVACVHAGLWAVSRDHISAPNFDGQLASVSYARRSKVTSQSGCRRRGPRRANSRRPQAAGAADARDPHLFVDRRRRTGARHRRRIRLARHGRRLDRQEPGPQRARNPLGDRSRQAPQQRQRHRGRQRNDLPRRAEGQRPDPDDPAGQALDQRAGHHRRNLARLDRASRTGLGGRLHRRAHPALLGRLLRQASRRSGDPDLRQAAPAFIPASAS